MIAETSATRPAVDNVAPGTSKAPGRGSRLSGTNLKPSASVSTATGTLSRNTEVQSNHSSSRPPKSGPRPTPIAAMALHTPIAFARSSRGKTLEMTERVAGMINAPPRPITARTAISSPVVSTSRTARLAPPNSTRPVCRASLRPKRSPSVPMVSRTPAKTSM